jgi:hypothetical protein
MNGQEKIEVTKLDVARRQLETAIWLYFTGGDPVSIHTLAAAALESIRSSAKAKGVMNIRNMTDFVVKPKYRKMMHRKFKETENFFKHGGSDESQEYSFNPQETDGVLLDGCLTYEGLNRTQTPIMKAFSWWFILNNPSVYNAQPEDEWFKTLTSTPLPTRKEYFDMARIVLRLNH